MTSEYKLILYATNGTKVAEVDDYLELTSIQTVNAPGRIDFVLDGNHRAIGLLSDRGPVQVLRKNTALGISWRSEGWGLYRAQERTYTDRHRFWATCPGLNSMLGWRHVLYAAGTANRSDFTNVAAETIAKTLVNYNLGANATTGNGRKVGGVLTGISVETDAAGGNPLDKAVAWQNLLSALQDIAAIGGGDFDLVAVTPATWQFRWYAGQLGTNRTATVVFAIERSNMANPRYVDDKGAEITCTIVGGQDTGANRAIEVVTGNGDGGGYHVEAFVNGSSLTTTAGLQAEGTRYLFDHRAMRSFDFDVLQVPATAYGLHYFLGDLVTAKFQDLVVTRKIVEVQLSSTADGAETIGVRTVDTG